MHLLRQSFLYYIAEHKDVSTPFMINLDGFVLTHTYETVYVPLQEFADVYLPVYETENKLAFYRCFRIFKKAGKI